MTTRLDPIQEDLDVLKATVGTLLRGQTKLRQDVAGMRQDIREIKVDLADVKSVVLRHDAQIVELERTTLRPARH